MARLKRHHLRNPSSVSSHDDISNSAAVGDKPVDGGGEKHSPARSVSDSSIQGTPPSPSVSDFIIQSIRPAISREDSAVKPKRSSGTSSSKRLIEQNDGEVKTSKKKKSSSPAAKATPKPVSGGGEHGAIHRLWSEEDEIAILKGVIDFRAKTGSEPSTDAVAFLDLIKDSIHVEASRSQLMSKLRKLKRKFIVNWEKCENGEDPVFNRSHDSTVFELSKKIWGKAASKQETVIRNNVTDSRKRAKKTSVKPSDAVVTETVMGRSSTLRPRRHDANAERQFTNLEPENGVGVEELADAAVATATAAANSNVEVVDAIIDVVVEKECNGKEIGCSDGVGDDEIEMAVEKEYDGKENGSSDEAVDDLNGMVVEKSCDGKENGGNNEAKSNPEVVEGGIETVMNKVCDKKGNDGRAELDINKVCDAKGGNDADATIWAQHPYLQDALEKIVAHGMVGEFHKRLLLEKVAVFEGGKGEEWNDQWKAYQLEAMQLRIKRNNLFTKFSEAMLEELKK